MRRFRGNVLLQFSVTSLLITVTIAMVLAIVLSNKMRSDAIEALMREAVGNARGRLLRAITPADLETPMRGTRYDSFHEFV